MQAARAEAYLAAYPGPADQIRIGLSRGVYPAADKRAAKAAIEAPVLRMAERMSRAARISIGRIVTAEEVADIVALIASPRSVAINGDAIAAGGGAPGAIHY